MRKAIAGLLLSSVLALGFVTAPASADTWTWRDDRDPIRKLSIESISAGHDENGPTVTITFDRPLDVSAMGPEDFIIVDVDSDGRGKSEEWAYLVAIEGRLTRFAYLPHGDTVYEIDESTWRRPTPRSVELSITRYAPGESHAVAAGSYTETAPGCGGDGCWDVVPNRGRLVHDWTPPQIKAVTDPALWQYDTYLKFTWEALDTGLSGFRRSTLLRSEPGSGKWRVVQVRTEPGRYRLRIPLKQGDNVMLRPVVQDGAGNKTLGPVRRVRVAYDQANPEGPGRFTGMWSEEETGGYGGSVHTSTAPMDSMTFPGRGNLYCLFARWGQEPVHLTFEVGGETYEADTFSSGGGSSDGFPICVPTATVERRVATLTVHAGRVGVDAYWAGVVPAEESETDDGGVREGNSAMPQTSGTSLSLGQVQAGLGKIGP